MYKAQYSIGINYKYKDYQGGKDILGLLTLAWLSYRNLLNTVTHWQNASQLITPLSK